MVIRAKNFKPKKVVRKQRVFEVEPTIKSGAAVGRYSICDSDSVIASGMDKKAAEAIVKYANGLSRPAKVVQPEVFIENDQIFPSLQLSNPVEITVRISAKTVTLNVGPRDWSWDRKTKKLIGAGTCLSQPVEDVTETVSTPETVENTN